uniref:NADH-ubiquinone oxidoreductase chain 2 n=1 Tax=Donax trunculus TaxID=40130 RepID=A0A250E5T6_9BIVA|nr:NADH dehydrogenase subunit 2 [Donax trunculus]ATA66396.1 NADH dehydrogenase subunit 2 [Donax trunculus]
MVWGVMLSPAFFIFFMISSLGTVMVILSGGLLGVWLSLELAFFGFIPILNGKSVCENESAVKYFIVQSIGSGFLLVSFLLISSQLNFVSTYVLSQGVIHFMMIMGFFIKLGVFPMHFWFPSVMGSASWFSCFWLGVVQKIGPFWGISGVGMASGLLTMFFYMAVFTSVVGALGGLAQTQIRPLLAYSSLGQTGWMSLILMSDLEIFIGYFMLYSLLLGGLLMGLNLINHYTVNGGVSWSEVSGFLFWLFGGSYFLSLVGMPPFAGFFLKLAGVFMIVNKFPLLLGVLMVSTMVSLYFYLNMFFSSVFCVGSMDYGMLSSSLLEYKIPAAVLFLSILNWLGGIPLILFSGYTVF